MKAHFILEMAHLILDQEIGLDDVTLDMTMGHGHDTLFLAKRSKHVYAFDIQKEAIDSTRHLLESHHIKNTTLIHDSHAHILKYVSTFKGALFNLGYLPKSDKKITTQIKTTLKTLEILLPALPYLGFVLLVIYRGHPEGVLESIGLDAYCKNLNQSTYRVLRIDLPYQNNQPPYILLIKKIKEEST